MEKKKQTIYAGIALLALALLVVGATYAYFQNQYGESSQTDVKVTTYTTDLLTFETGDPINITADQESFAQGKGNQTGSSFAKAILQANSKTNVATANYYIYLNIESNEFTYTTTGKPELVLQVTDNSGSPVTNIDGVTYVTVVDGSGTSISGFDITDKSGLINLVNNKEINASPKTEEQYNVTLVLVNYDFDQNNNAGKSFNAKLMIRKDKTNFLSDYVISQYTGTQGENGLYYHDSSLENGAGDNSYRYAGASDVVNNYVCFGSDENACPVDNLYRIIGVFDGRLKLIKADYATSTLLGKDGDYKTINDDSYLQENANYKGNTSEYKVGGYMWDSSMSNSWSASLLNKTNLNTNYLNNITNKWSNMIDTTTWKVGSSEYVYIYNQIPSVTYRYEIVNPSSNITYEAKIGLMYVSDYGFAADPSAWTTIVNNYNDNSIKLKNWLYLGLYEWTISRDLYTEMAFTGSFVIEDSGRVAEAISIAVLVLRPTFYLKSSVEYSSGSGTSTDPIRISVK